MHNLSTQTRCIAVLGCASSDALGHAGTNPLFWVSPMATKISSNHVEQMKYHFTRICVEFVANKNEFLNNYMLKQLRANVKALVAAAVKDGSKFVLDTARKLNLGEILMELDIACDDANIDINAEIEKDKHNDDINIEIENENDVNNEEDNKNDDDMDIESENNFNDDEADDDFESDMDCDEEW